VIQGALPNLLISPAFHLQFARLCELRGNDERAMMERSIAGVCLRGIPASGSGPAGDPYLVSRTPDEYDVLNYLDKGLGKQALIHDGDKRPDVMRCKDGAELWFDVTEADNRLPGEISGDH
jgi:hypothetical protein